MSYNLRSHIYFKYILMSGFLHHALVSLLHTHTSGKKIDGELRVINDCENFQFHALLVTNCYLHFLYQLQKLPINIIWDNTIYEISIEDRFEFSGFVACGTILKFLMNTSSAVRVKVLSLHSRATSTSCQRFHIAFCLSLYFSTQ